MRSSQLKKSSKSTGTAVRKKNSARAAIVDQQTIRKDLIRDRLIDTAAEVFYARGYKQSNISDLSSALQLSRSSIYYYFKNKKEVLAALLEREVSVPYNANQRLMERKDLTPSERLREAVTLGIVRRLSGEPRFLVLSRLEADGMPADLTAFYNASKRKILDQYTRMIADCIAGGEFRNVDPQLAAFTVIGMANWTSWWYSPSGRNTPREIGDAIIDLAFFGFMRRDVEHNSATQVRQAVGRLKKELELLQRFVS
jgi:AcrR family transcriptional regulator